MSWLLLEIYILLKIDHPAPCRILYFKMLSVLYTNLFSFLKIATFLCFSCKSENFSENYQRQTCSIKLKKKSIKLCMMLTAVTNKPKSQVFVHPEPSGNVPSCCPGNTSSKQWGRDLGPFHHVPLHLLASQRSHFQPKDSGGESLDNCSEVFVTKSDSVQYNFCSEFSLMVLPPSQRHRKDSLAVCSGRGEGHSSRICIWGITCYSFWLNKSRALDMKSEW